MQLMWQKCMLRFAMISLELSGQFSCCPSTNTHRHTLPKVSTPNRWRVYRLEMYKSDDRMLVRRLFGYWLSSSDCACSCLCIFWKFHTMDKYFVSFPHFVLKKQLLFVLSPVNSMKIFLFHIVCTFSRHFWLFWWQSRIRFAMKQWIVLRWR